MIRPIKQSEIEKLNHLPPIDWQFDYSAFLKDFLPTDFFYAFVMMEEDKITGTGNILIKDGVAWFANIIVDEKYRGKGLGFKMTKFLIDFSIEKGCETQLLVATELGEPLYKKLGFKKLTDYRCFDSDADVDFKYSNSIRELTHSDLPSVYKLDKEANDENRKHLIGKFYQKGLGYFSKDNELLGCYLPNFGRGLVLSTDEKVGIKLLKIKHSEAGRITLLPIENQAAIDFFENSELKEGDRCSKMILGKMNNWKPEFVFSYASGYCG